LSAVVTPDATLFTMLLMAVPLMVLYEVGIVGARLFGRTPAAEGPAPVEAAVPMGTAGHRVR
jgi:sec-independent protein translocase protein TatC